MSPRWDAPRPCCSEGGGPRWRPRERREVWEDREVRPSGHGERPRRGGRTPSATPQLGESRGWIGGCRCGGGHPRHVPSRWAPALRFSRDPGRLRPFPVLGQERVRPTPPLRVGPPLPGPQFARGGGEPPPPPWPPPHPSAAGPVCSLGVGKHSAAHPPAAQTLQPGGAGAGVPVICVSPSPPSRWQAAHSPPPSPPPHLWPSRGDSAPQDRGGDGDGSLPAWGGHAQGDDRTRARHPHVFPPHTHPPAPHYGRWAPRASFFTPTSPNPCPAPCGDPGGGSQELWGRGMGGRGGDMATRRVPTLTPGLGFPRPGCVTLIRPRYPWNLLMAACCHNTAQCQASPRVGISPSHPPNNAPPGQQSPPRGPHDPQLTACRGGGGGEGKRGCQRGGRRCWRGGTTRGWGGCCLPRGGLAPGGRTVGKGPSAQFYRPRPPPPRSPPVPPGAPRVPPASHSPRR